jgi:hypothetical protein
MKKGILDALIRLPLNKLKKYGIFNNPSHNQQHKEHAEGDKQLQKEGLTQYSRTDR